MPIHSNSIQMGYRASQACGQALRHVPSVLDESSIAVLFRAHFFVLTVSSLLDRLTPFQGCAPRSSSSPATIRLFVPTEPSFWMPHVQLEALETQQSVRSLSTAPVPLFRSTNLFDRPHTSHCFRSFEFVLLSGAIELVLPSAGTSFRPRSSTSRPPPPLVHLFFDRPHRALFCRSSLCSCWARNTSACTLLTIRVLRFLHLT